MFGCLLLVIVTSGASVWEAGNVDALAIIRFVNGLAAGFGFTVGAVALIGSPQVERWYAIFFGMPFVIGGVGMATLPYVYHLSGISGAFYGIGAINLLVAFLLPYFPKTIMHEAKKEKATSLFRDRQLSMMTGVLLVALFLHYLFNSGIWTYFERLGVAYGMSPETAGLILGPSMFAAIAGMIGASVLGNRLGYLRPIYSGTVVIMFSTIMLLFSQSDVAFAVGTALFNASITFVTPYFIALLALLVPSGLGVSTANVATLLGFSTGPYLLSYLIEDNKFRPSIILTALGFLIVISLVFWFSRMLRRTEGLQSVKAVCESRGAT